jgi:hypothetical protein
MVRIARQSTERRAYAACLLAGLTAVACAALMTAVALTPAPAAVVPLAVVVCIGCPLAMAWSLPHAIAVLRGTAAGAGGEDQALHALRKYLSRLPETEHPLGL